MWSRIASPRPRQRAGGGGGGSGAARRNSNTGSLGPGSSRPGSVKARDYDHRVGGRTTSIKDRRKAASRNYEDDVEWGDDGGGGGMECGGDWEDSPRGMVSFTPTVVMAPPTPMRSGASVDEDEEEVEAEEEDNDEVVASLDSLSSHQSSIMLDRVRGLAAVADAAAAASVAPVPPPQTTTSTTTFPRILPIPARYRIRDFLLGDFSFNDDGER